MPVLECLNGYVVNPGATETNIIMAGNDSLQIRSFNQGQNAWLIGMWALVQAAGIFKIRSPKMHDNVQGIRFNTIGSNGYNLLPSGTKQPLYSQDILTVTLSAADAALDIEQVGMLIYYENVEGAGPDLFSWSDIENNIVQFVTVQNTIVAGVTGGYGPAEALDADFNLLKANTKYALIGYTISSEQGSIVWSGTDTGNFNIGGPGLRLEKDRTIAWFKDLSEKTGLPCIPVINSANKSNTFVNITSDENAITPIIQSIFAELG